MRAAAAALYMFISIYRDMAEHGQGGRVQAPQVSVAPHSKFVAFKKI